MKKVVAKKEEEKKKDPISKVVKSVEKPMSKVAKAVGVKTEPKKPKQKVVVDESSDDDTTPTLADHIRETMGSSGYPAKHKISKNSTKDIKSRHAMSKTGSRPFTEMNFAKMAEETLRMMNARGENSSTEPIVIENQANKPLPQDSTPRGDVVVPTPLPAATGPAPVAPAAAQNTSEKNA